MLTTVLLVEVDFPFLIRPSHMKLSATNSNTYTLIIVTLVIGKALLRPQDSSEVSVPKSTYIWSYIHVLTSAFVVAISKSRDDCPFVS